MRINKTAPLIIIGFVIALSFHFFAIAAIDAPHNEESNDVECGSCHGDGILESVFWGGSGTYDRICTDRCHSPQQTCPYTPLYGPLVETHIDSDETALAECRTCHDPHYQKQKNYKNTDWNNLYLAYGTITSYKYYDPDYFDENLRDTSVLAYSSITYKTATGWDATRLTGKTEDCRRTILFPNERKLGYSYVIIAIEEVTPTTGTIQVKGDVTPVYQYISSSNFAVIYGQFIRDNINGNTVKFFDQVGANSFSDGDGIYNGVCEVCHTLTEHYRNDGSAPQQKHENLGGKDGTNCVSCHWHTWGFVHGGATAGADCIECHGHDAGYEYETGKFSQGKGTYISHSTHTEFDPDDLNGPELDCPVCHATDNYPFFRLDSGTDINGDQKIDLTETNLCDNCHSIGGAYDGVGVPYDKDNPNFAEEYPNSVAYGAKYHWKYKEGETWVQGVYSEIPVKYWQQVTYYNEGDFVRYQFDVYRANKSFTSGNSFDENNWDLVNPWQSNTAYQVDDYVRHHGNVYKCLTVFISGDSFDESNWDLICRWLEPLKTGKEKWCIGCHDDVPANSMQNGTGILAPKVGGDNSIYGFYVSGHGRTGIEKECLDCHDSTYIHIDGEARTYEAASDNYQEGYRLNTSMKIPQRGNMAESAFALCYNCHLYDDQFRFYTNFRDDRYAPDRNYHELHLSKTTAEGIVWDSDWDSDPAAPGSGGQYADAKMSCPACHNVHGSQMYVNGVLSQNPVMIRHGELISTPSTSDKVPAFDFHWYENDDVTMTGDFNLSRSGGMLCGNTSNLDYNHVCYGCHDTGEIKYYRDPDAKEGVITNEVWTTDLNNNRLTTFSPGDSIRYHVSFTVFGVTGRQYELKTRNSRAQSTDYPDAVGSWSTGLNSDVYLAPSATPYEWTWDRTIPIDANYVPAVLSIKVRMFWNGDLWDEGNRKESIFTIE